MNSVSRVLNGVRTRVPAYLSRSDVTEIVWSWIGAFLGIATLAFLHCVVLEESDQLMLIGSFGATAVLLFGAIDSPLAQPRNTLGGHFLSALVGVTAFQLLGHSVPIAAAAAVATAIAVMQLTNTVHPPGGATALIAVIGSDKVHNLGYAYALAPVGCGALIMLLIALAINNLAKGRRYPTRW